MAEGIFLQDRKIGLGRRNISGPSNPKQFRLSRSGCEEDPKGRQRELCSIEGCLSWAFDASGSDRGWITAAS